MTIFIKKLTIQNYKCFENEPISLAVPDGNRGSGLNILIGENGNGKTTVLEAINYLTLNSFSAENKLSINDFCDFKKEIVVEAETDEFNCVSSIDFYKDWSFKANGISFKAKSRDTKERGNLLSSLFQINNSFISEPNYVKKDGSSGKEIDGRDKIFSKSRINEGELNIFFFDKNRTRQITTGNYKTAFEKICDDLNWNFVRNLTDENSNTILQNVSGEYFKNVDGIANKNFGKKTAKELKEFFGKEEFEKVKIELLNILHPFSNSFFALRDENALSQINVGDLGSGVEIILTLLILKNIAGASKGSIIYLIDEPELHLHPKAQDKLLDLLLEEAKNKQIIVSTHSPYLFKGAISQNAKLLLFTRNNQDQIEVADTRDKGWGILPRSPSWGEINYSAYDLPTTEFHNELYGYLQEKEQKYILEDIEAYFETKNITKSKKWTKIKNGQSQTPEDVTLMTFVRNSIHHPENTLNGEYTPEELKSSIEELIKLIRNP